MVSTPHLDRLREKHETLKQSIKREERQPGTDHLHIAKLKREKLHLKEEIKRLSDNVRH